MNENAQQASAYRQYADRLDHQRSPHPSSEREIDEALVLIYVCPTSPEHPHTDLIQ